MATIGEQESAWEAVTSCVDSMAFHSPEVLPSAAGELAVAAERYAKSVDGFEQPRVDPDVLRLANGLVTQTLMGPVPMETVCKLASEIIRIAEGAQP